MCFRATLGDVALTLAAYLAIALAAREFGHCDFVARERRVARLGEAAHGAVVEEEEGLRTARPQRRRPPPP